MALSISNLLNQNAQGAQSKIFGSTPQSVALNNKVNPSPLPPVKTPSMTPTSVTTSRGTFPIVSGPGIVQPSLTSNMSQPIQQDSQPFRPVSNSVPPLQQPTSTYIAPPFRGASYSGPQSPITGPTQIQGAPVQSIQQPMGTNVQTGQATPVQNIQQVQPRDQYGNPVGQPVSQVPQQGALGALLNQLTTTATQGSPRVQEAQQNLASAIEQQKAFEQQVAGTSYALNKQGIPLPDITGQQANLAQLAATQRAALQGAVSASQQALGTAQTQESQRLGALEQAGALAKSTPTAFGQAVFNPLTGQLESGGGAYGTGPEAAANVQSIIDQTQQVNTWSSARQSAMNLGTQLNSLIQGAGVNPSDLNAVNRFIQTVAKNVSDPQYAKFHNLVNDLAASYAQILTPPGGSPSDYRTQIAQSMLDASAKGQSIVTIVNSLDDQAQAKIAGVQQNIQNIQSGQNVNIPSSTQSVSGWSW